MKKHFNRPSSRTRAAFTLIELLTVIAIIGILAAILIPTVGKVRVTARKAQCVARLRQWGAAVGLCANDYKNQIPIFYKNDAGFIYDAYFSAKSISVEDASKGTMTRDLRPTEAMTQCPNGLNGGNGSNRQYAFVVPIGVTAKDAKRFGLFTSTANFYSISDASSPAKLLLMMENDLGGTQVLISPGSLGGIQTELNDKVRSVQLTTGRIRHGGVANALFLDGHVAGLNTADTDYSNTESKERLNTWFSLK